MALAISKVTPSGVDATYWRLVYGTIDYARATLDITINGYKDAAARQAGAEPLGVWHKTWAGAEFVDVAEPTRAALYAKIMADPYWAGATEV